MSSSPAGPEPKGGWSSHSTRSAFAGRSHRSSTGAPTTTSPTNHSLSCPCPYPPAPDGSVPTDSVTTVSVFRRNEDEPPPSGRKGRAARLRRGASGHRPGGRGEGGAEDQEQFIIDALGDLRDMVVREVMTPRVDVVALSIPLTAEAVTQAVRESGHSCFPVYGDNLDDLVGVLFVNDLFRAGWTVAGITTGAETSQEPLPAGGPGRARAAPGPIDISRRVRQPFLVPESRLVLDVLAEMRRQRRAFAVVVDEHGGVEGVLTIKDLLGALVGDLADEFDSDDEPDVVRVDGDRWLMDGRMSVDDVRDRLGINVPEGEYVTLGGFLFDRFGHIPAEGETFDVGGWQLRVSEMDKRRIAKVVAKRVGSSPVAADSGVSTGDAGNDRTAVG